MYLCWFSPAKIESLHAIPIFLRRALQLTQKGFIYKTFLSFFLFDYTRESKHIRWAELNSIRLYLGQNSTEILRSNIYMVNEKAKQYLFSSMSLGPQSGEHRGRLNLLFRLYRKRFLVVICSSRILKLWYNQVHFNPKHFTTF